MSDLIERATAACEYVPDEIAAVIGELIAEIRVGRDVATDLLGILSTFLERK